MLTYLKNVYYYETILILLCLFLKDKYFTVIVHQHNERLVGENLRCPIK